MMYRVQDSDDSINILFIIKKIRKKAGLWIRFHFLRLRIQQKKTVM